MYVVLCRRAKNSLAVPEHKNHMEDLCGGGGGGYYHMMSLRLIQKPTSCNKIQCAVRLGGPRHQCEAGACGLC